MIVDRCKPLNEGEHETVRIVMSIGEALELRRALESATNPLFDGLRESLVYAIGRKAGSR